MARAIAPRRWWAHTEQSSTLGSMFAHRGPRWAHPVAQPSSVHVRRGGPAAPLARPLVRLLPWLPARLAALFAVGVALVTMAVLPALEAAAVADRVGRRLTTHWFGPIGVPEGPRRSTIYGADGSVLHHVYWGYNRAPVPLERIPELTRRAVLAIEDARFYQHFGVDLAAVGRALVANLEAGRIVQGGSTITQQLAEQAITGRTRTLADKLREARAAIRLERNYTKDEILELYLNRVHLGRDLYGIGAAARYYFGRRPGKLTLPRSALLAGMIAAPARHDPIRRPKAARARRAVVLRRMLELGWITEGRYQRAVRAPLGLSRRLRKAATPGPTSFFEQFVIKESLTDPRLGRTVGERRRLLFRGGVRVHTTLDPRLQRAAERVLLEQMTGPGLPQSAIVSVEPGTGALRAMAVGNWPFGKRRYNLAAPPGGGRSPGSAFKVFTLAAALLDGISPGRVYNGDSPKAVPSCGDGETWRLKNAEPGSGSYTLAQATVRSVNTVFAQVIDDVGPKDVARVARRMGIRSPLTPVCPLTLGTSAVSPLEMTAAAGTLAAGGIHCEPHAIREVVSADGEVLLRNRPRCRRSMPGPVAALETAILEEVIRSGTGWAAGIGRPAAGKTGTAQNLADAWFLGYVPQLATAVWVGHAKAEIPMPYVPGIGPGYGGVLAAPIWRDYMLEATRGLPVEAFPPPPDSPFPRSTVEGVTTP